MSVLRKDLVNVGIGLVARDLGCIGAAGKRGGREYDSRRTERPSRVLGRYKPAASVLDVNAFIDSEFLSMSRQK